MPSIRRHVPFELIVPVVYTISLWLPAIEMDMRPLNSGEALPGGLCLALGWGTPSWYANVMLGIAAIALGYRRPRVAAVCSLAAIALALTTFHFLGAHLRAVHVGYFVWLASMVLMFVASCARSRRDR